MLDAAYVDGYRSLHGGDPATPSPLDRTCAWITFRAFSWSRRLTGCSVVRRPSALAQASTLPLQAELPLEVDTVLFRISLTP